MVLNTQANSSFETDDTGSSSFLQTYVSKRDVECSMLVIEGFYGRQFNSSSVTIISSHSTCPDIRCLV